MVDSARWQAEQLCCWRTLSTTAGQPSTPPASLPPCLPQAASERNEIEREMNRMLFERSKASQEAVLKTLVDEMARWARHCGWEEGLARGGQLASFFAQLGTGFVATPCAAAVRQCCVSSPEPNHRMCRQHVRECFLAYCCLLAVGKELTGGC